MENLDAIEGVELDFLFKFFNVKDTVNKKISEIPEETINYIKGYADGLNYYAAKNPNLAPPTAAQLKSGKATGTVKTMKPAPENKPLEPEKYEAKKKRNEVLKQRQSKLVKKNLKEQADKSKAKKRGFFDPSFFCLC